MQTVRGLEPLVHVPQIRCMPMCQPGVAPLPMPNGVAPPAAPSYSTPRLISTLEPASLPSCLVAGATGPALLACQQ